VAGIARRLGITAEWARRILLAQAVELAARELGPDEDDA
jgi:hypothetical protein